MQPLDFKDKRQVELLTYFIEQLLIVPGGRDLAMRLKVKVYAKYLNQYRDITLDTEEVLTLPYMVVEDLITNNEDAALHKLLINMSEVMVSRLIDDISVAQHPQLVPRIISALMERYSIERLSDQQDHVAVIKWLIKNWTPIHHFLLKQIAANLSFAQQSEVCMATVLLQDHLHRNREFILEVIRGLSPENTADLA